VSGVRCLSGSAAVRSVPVRFGSSCRVVSCWHGCLSTNMLPLACKLDWLYLWGCSVHNVTHSDRVSMTDASAQALLGGR
jgi:hypothetical protein